MSSDLTHGWPPATRPISNGDDEAAEAAYRRALEEGEEDAAYYLGDLLVQLNRAEEAEPLLRGVIAAGDPTGTSRSATRCGTSSGTTRPRPSTALPPRSARWPRT